MQTRSEAQAALDRLREEKARATEELAAAREALDRLETESGDRLLATRLAGDETAAAVIREELTVARLAVAEGEKIITACDRAIEAAQRDVLAAQAHELRADVAKRWPQLRDRIAATQKILDELTARESVRWIPEPVVAESGAVASGSWRRTKTGEAVAALIELEREAAALESRAGVVSPPSIVAGRADLALFLGSPGTFAAAVQLKVGGASYIDDASAVLGGRKLPEPYVPTVQDLVRVKLGG